MKLSVIVTTWGVEPWVAVCRESLRAAEGALRAARADWEVEVLEVCNGGGAGAARNEGLRKTAGEYVWFVDGDDAVREDSLVRIAQAIAAHPGVDIVHFDLAPWDGSSCRAEAALPHRAHFDLTKTGGRIRAYRRHARWLLGSSAVYRRAAVTGLRFGGFVKGEDSLWGRQAFYRAQSLVYIAASLYLYRRRPAGADQARDARHVRDARRVGWRMFVEGLRVPSLVPWVVFDWLRYRFRELPKWYNARHVT